MGYSPRGHKESTRLSDFTFTFTFQSRSLHNPVSLTHQRADRRSKKHSLMAAKTKTILQKVNHDEKAESYVPDKGTR